MNRLLFSILRVFPCIKCKIIKKKWRKKNLSEKNFSHKWRKNFLTSKIFFLLMKFFSPMNKLSFLYNFGFYTRKIPKNWKKQSVHLFFSFFLNAQIFFLPFEQIFPRFIRKKKNWLWNPLEFLVACGHSKFQNWVPSPIFSSLWTC